MVSVGSKRTEWKMQSAVLRGTFPDSKSREKVATFTKKFLGTAWRCKCPIRSVVGAPGDVDDMGAQAFHNLLDVLELLGAQVGVVQNPVVLLPVLMLTSQCINGTV